TDVGSAGRMNATTTLRCSALRSVVRRTLYRPRAAQRSRIAYSRRNRVADFLALACASANAVSRFAFWSRKESFIRSPALGAWRGRRRFRRMVDVESAVEIPGAH